MSIFSFRRWHPRRFMRWISRKNAQPRHTPKSIDNSLSDGSVLENPRYSPCRILYEAGVPCVIWGEDALTEYDIPTVVFDLFLLVHNPENAAQVLASHGFTRTAPSSRFYDIPQMSDDVPRLAQIPASTTHHTADLPDADDVYAPGVILLPVEYWRYRLPLSVDLIDTFVPPLSTLFNTLIAVWIDLPEDSLALMGHVAIWIGYFYLYNQDIRKPEFENEILVENRQVHFEMLRGNDSPYVQITSRKHQEYHRNIRDQIRLGQYKPRKITGKG